MMNLKAIQVAAWASLIVVALAALVPIELRPTSSLPPTIERFGAFAAVGFAFALAYPRRFWLAAFVVIGAAMLLEVMQVLAPSRHGRIPDASIKVLGAAAGLMFGRIVLAWQMRWTRTESQAP